MKKRSFNFRKILAIALMIPAILLMILGLVIEATTNTASAIAFFIAILFAMGVFLYMYEDERS